MDLALGPNAGTVVEAAPRLRERFGLDPLAAERLVAIGGSYAFGLRIDGVDGGELRPSWSPTVATRADPATFD